MALQVSTVVDWSPLCSTTWWCAFKVGWRLLDHGRLWSLILAAKYAGIVAARCALQPETPLDATHRQQNGEHNPGLHNSHLHGSLEQWDQGRFPRVRYIDWECPRDYPYMRSLCCRILVLREPGSKSMIKAERRYPITAASKASGLREIINEISGLWIRFSH